MSTAPDEPPGRAAETVILPGGTGGSRPSHWVGLLIAGAILVLAAALTWRKWPDILIDFGMQLYLPWQLSTGSVLYRDVAYLTGGPFSQYYAALLFKVFGASLQTLIVSNLMITAGLMVLIFRQFLAVADAWTATTIALAIVLVFAFGQYGDIGNYNFITPYCHEVFHGVVISILAIALLANWVAQARIRFALGAGFCGGLVFMTKPEVFLALAISAGAAFVLDYASRRRAGFALRSLMAFLIAGCIPLFGFLFYFHTFEDWRSSLRSVGFAWVPLLESAAGSNAYYRWCLGLDMPAYHLRKMLVHFVAITLLVGSYAFLFRRKMDSRSNRLILLAAVVPMLALASRFDWTDCGRALPLLVLASCILLGVNYKRLALERAPVFPLLWSVFALALLAKLGVFSRIWHYGFILAMPAFVSAIYLLLWLLPKLLEKYGVQRQLFRGTVWLVLMIGFLFLFMQSQLFYQPKALAVGRGKDRIMVANEERNPAGGAVQAALAWIEKNIPTDATLAVLPEGVMINYLSRRTNPTHHLVWNPVELAAFGQAEMTADFQKHSPDYIVLIHRDGAEYGVKMFGQQAEFGRELMQWIQAQYEPVYLIGSEPLQRPSAFGIKILKRSPAR